MARTPLERAIMLFVIIAPLLATVYGIVLLWNRWITGLDVALLLTLYSISVLGITVGFHRMLVHRSFEPHPVIKFLFLFFGCLALEGTPQRWAGTHIKHHATSDTEDDPHSPLAGFFHAHFGWLVGDGLVDLNVYGKWLQKDKMVMFMTRTWVFWATLGFAIPYGVGYAAGGPAAAWQALFWGGIVRVCLMHHVTWSVNSVCHVWGGRMFESNDASRNNPIVGLLAFGEGWHNNHHAFPRSAFHGLRWWQIDISGYIIWMMEKFGLVKNVWRIPTEDFERRLLRPAPKGIPVTAITEEAGTKPVRPTPRVSKRARAETGR